MRNDISTDFQIRTRRLRLRACTSADVGRMVEIQSNWNVTRMLRLATWPPTGMAMQDWLETHAQEWRAGSAYRFGLELDGRLIGCADLDGIDGETGDIGYWLDEAFWRQGYASEALGAVIAFAFQTLGLRRLTAGHAVENVASARVLEKHRFQPVSEGVRYNQPQGQDVPYHFVALSAA